MILRPDKPTADLSPTSRIKALEANVAAFGCRYGRGPNAEVKQTQGITLFVSGIADPFFNGVSHASVPERDADARIEGVFTMFQSRQLPFLWNTGPSTRPVDLDARLTQRRPFLSIPLPGMALDLAALTGVGPLPTGFQIEEVTTRSQLEQWVALGCTTFEMSAGIVPAVADLEDNLGMGADQPWRRYVGSMNGEVVATSMLMFGGGAAGIYWVATRPDKRGLGIGRALTAYPLLAARSRGYRLAVLQSSALGHSVYRKLGFEDCCQMMLHMWR